MEGEDSSMKSFGKRVAMAVVVCGDIDTVSIFGGCGMSELWYTEQSRKEIQQRSEQDQVQLFLTQYV